MSFEFIIKNDGRKVQKAKVQEIEDFEPILDGLKEKFSNDTKRRRR